MLSCGTTRSCSPVCKLMKHMLSLLETLWLPITISLFVIIAILSLWPLDHLPEVPGSDKTHHLIAYMTLMFPVALRRPRYWLVIGLVVIALSGLIELLQPYVNRHGEWLDLAANTAGILGGGVLGSLCRRFNPPTREEPLSS